ncbi:type IV pilus modification PilV family protein [Chrysiogenes arsenatis]|uniref:type IV pilus modification PilV family protein n=1 Tax=Chrysiogenes arsenatis TaxID=309797 RepID=UPI0004240CFC|nr:type II secretion system protein [Chrysiogenes arsenatis]
MRVTKGFSLIEMIVFIVVIGIAATGLLGVFAPVLLGAPTSGDILRRTYLAMERVELMYAYARQDSFDEWCATGGAPCSSTAYTVTHLIDSGDYLGSNPVYHITVNVSDGVDAMNFVFENVYLVSE